MKRFSIVLMLVFLLTGNVIMAQNSVSRPDTVVVYKKTGEAALKMYIFLPDRQDTDKAALVLFHGGGWNNGKPDYMFRHATWFAKKRGMVVFCPQYRLRNKNHTTIVEAVKDAESAVAWVRKHAKTYGFNPQKIVVGGGSAGGHLAIMTALNTRAKIPEPAKEYKPNALLLFNPVLDVSQNGYGHHRIVEELKAYSGLTWKDFSPINNIKPGLPPTMIVVGNHDKVLPEKTARAFEKKMKEAGNDCSLKIYPGGEHSFFNYGYAKKEGYPPSTKNRYFYEVLQQADNFLVNHGFLTHPVKIAVPKDAVYPIRKEK